MIRLINIDKKNYLSIINLNPGEENKEYIDDISECILKHLFYRKSVIKGIYLNETPIGFVMIYNKYNNKWISEFMIDQEYQRKGYGKIALKLIIRYIEKKYFSSKIYLSTNNNLAERLYLKFGFIKLDDSFSDIYKSQTGEDVFVLNLKDMNYYDAKNLGLDSVLEI